MAPRRFYCSHLAVLTHNSGGAAAGNIVILEEIWETGASLEAESSVAEGAEVELDCGPAWFAGRIIRVEQHELGWLFEVEFAPETPWNPAEFQPMHLLDPATLDPDAQPGPDQSSRGD